MKRKKRRKYGRDIGWLFSNKHTYPVSKKHKLAGILLIVIILIIAMSKSLNKEKIKPEKTNHEIQTLDYTPIQEIIAAFEIPVRVSKQVFAEAKKDKKQVASLFATYIIEKEKGKDDEDILSNITKHRPGIFSSKKTKTMYKEAIHCYQQFILDLEVFPIPLEYEYAFENSWKAERSYGGARKHYGVDIMDPKNETGVIPVVSMSYGIVENIGWNNMGGYRVGVRTPNEAYIYYAHLNKYAPKLNKGTKLAPGDLIGYMGDSGYGEEGTVGEFPVHLHIGIATNALGSTEAWVNPYYLLKYLEDKYK